jgi:3-hydroxyisobutyrate dehydrogenase-like beta-hydroxyacid dehydrogenase
LASPPRICLLGFGEVGQRLATDLIARNVAELCAWDIQFANTSSQPSRAIENCRVRRAADARDAVHQAQLVISAVTAEQDLAAAESIAPHLARNVYFLDLNSVSPATKKKVSEQLSAVGAQFIEAAIMSPIAPLGVASPMLLGGPHAPSFLPMAIQLGLAGAKVFSTEVGKASAAKMCRSVMIKGIEALLGESLVGAHHYGVEETVLESLRNLFPGADWNELARYMISRSLLHGARRAEEMREAAQTVRDAGLEPWMSLACVERQSWAAQHRQAAECRELSTLLDRLIHPLIR